MHIIILIIVTETKEQKDKEVTNRLKRMESKYGTEVMKDDECLLFVETAIENGSDVNEAIEDSRAWRCCRNEMLNRSTNFK